VYYDSTEAVELVSEFDIVECKEPKISLNAILGSLRPKSMRLLGFFMASSSQYFGRFRKYS